MLEFLDSFDLYSTAEIPLRWQNSQFATIDPAGRHGNALKLAGGSVSKTVNYNSSWVVGFAFLWQSNNIAIGAIYEGNAVGAPGPLISIVVESDGSVSLYSGTPSIATLMGNTGGLDPPFIMNRNTWYYIELKYSMGGSTNIDISGATLRINKHTLLTGLGGLTGFNVNNSLIQQPESNEHTFLGGPGIGSAYFDDLYIFNQDGGVNDDFAGDIKILAIFPNQDLSTPYSQFPSGSANSYGLVNEHPPDYDNTYVYSNVNNQFENFYWQHLPAFFGNVICVQYSVFARKDDEGSRAFQLTLGSGPNKKSSQNYLGDTYLYYMWPLDTDNGVPWTVAIFNGESFGLYIYTIPTPS